MRLKLLIPPQYDSPFVPSVRGFYDVLIEYLDDRRDVDLAIHRDRGAFDADPALRKITYHTRSETSTNIKIGYLPDHFYVDASGYSGWASLANVVWRPGRYTAETDDRFEALSSYYIDNNLSKYAQQDFDANDRDGSADGVISIFTQTMADRVAHFMPKRWDRFLQHLVERIVLANPDERIVIKRHPRCSDVRMSDAISQIEERHAGRVELSCESIHRLIARSRAVFVGNSGVGFEALLHAKPVFSFAHSDYHHATFPSALSEIGDYMEKIDAFDDERRRLIRQFVVHYLDDYMVTCDASRIERRLESLGLFRTD